MKKVINMVSLADAFGDRRFQELIKQEIPRLMEKADIEGSRYGNTGMEKGSTRKKNLVDLLIDYFGEDNVETTFPQNLPGIDLKIDSQLVKIKTITGNRGVKIKWTVDPNKVEDFISEYSPSCNILLVKLNWNMKERNQPSGLFWIPLEAQRRVLKQLGVERYLKPPKPGTNSRGIELSKPALEHLLNDEETKHIDVDW